MHSNFGAALFSSGRTDEAIAHERRALELDPTIARAHANLAAALLKKGQLAEARNMGKREHMLDAAVGVGEDGVSGAVRTGDSTFRLSMHDPEFDAEVTNETN